MHQPVRWLYLFKACLRFALPLIIWTSCNTGASKNEHRYDSQFSRIDSLIIADDPKIADSLLDNMRLALAQGSAPLARYYSRQAERYSGDWVRSEKYADSALTFFNANEVQDKYPNTWYRALISKGDACMADGRYHLALSFYGKTRQSLGTVTVDNGTLNSKIASIYYNQKNYLLAARYLAAGNKELASSKKKYSPAQYFYLQQAALDNLGKTYEMAGIPDSAFYYYHLDEGCVDKAETDKPAAPKVINDARIVLYDNLGGLYLYQQNNVLAARYLQKCLAVPTTDVNGMRIPPNLKFAELALKTGKLDVAAKAFADARELLNRFPKDNFPSEISWNRLYAAYLIKLNRPEEAYRAQAKYIRVKDSVESVWTKLYQLNIDHEISAIHDQQVVAELKHGNSIKMTYLIAVLVIVVLVTLLLVQISHSLRNSRSTHQEVTGQNIRLQQALTEVEELNKNYIRVMRVMAHDLRNPLSGIIGLAELLSLDDTFADDSRHMLDLIGQTGTNSLLMIDELLKNGLTDVNEKIVTTPVDLNQLLNDTIELLRFKAFEKQQQLVYESNNNPLIANVNREKIWRVFNNIIVNAIKFSHKADEIDIKVSQNDGKALITIADNGVGIPAEDAGKVFEMFTTAKKAGTGGEEPFGLGLSISKRIIEQHNGRIWFEPRPAGGTIFFIELPVDG